MLQIESRRVGARAIALASGSDSSRSMAMVVAVAVAMAILALFAATGESALLFEDRFDYPNGNLIPNGGWAAHANGGDKPIQVSSSRIRLQQSALSGEDVNRPFTPQGSGAVVYASFFLTVPPAIIGSAPEYFAHFRQSSTTNFRTRVGVGPAGVVGGDFGLYLWHGSTAPSVQWPVPLRFDITYLIVAQYHGGANLSRLWVNPVSDLSPNISVTDLTAPVSFNSYAFRQASPTGGNYTEWIDHLRVATSFNEAYPALDVIDISADASDARDPDLTLLTGGRLFAAWGRAGHRSAYTHSPGRGVNFFAPSLLELPSRQPATIQTHHEVTLVASVTPDGLHCARTGEAEISLLPSETEIESIPNPARPEFANDAAPESMTVAVVWDVDSIDIHYAYTTDQGVTFSAPIAIGAGDGQPHWRPDVDLVNFRVEVVWNYTQGANQDRIGHARTTAPDRFDVPDVLSDPSRRAFDPQISYAGGPTWDVVWIYRGGGGAPDSLVLFTSTNDGVSYLHHAAVAVPAMVGTARNTSMIRGPDGTLHIVFEAEVEGHSEVLYASIGLARIAFNGPFNISHAPDDSLDPDVALDVNGRPVFVWSEPMGGVRDIAFARWVLP